MNELFESNLLNWCILVLCLGFLWNKFMPQLFADRRHRINQALTHADQAKKEGEAFLAQQKERIANAEKEAEGILVEAREVAERMKASISEQAQKDAQDLQKKIDQQIATHRQMVIAELRSQAAVVAVQLTEATLPGAITDNVKQSLQDGFVGQLESMGATR